jgi:putative transposase
MGGGLVPFQLKEGVDKRAFLKRLIKYKGRCNYKVYGYCLMDNHVHLLMKETNESISDILQRVSSSYVYRYNQKYVRCGHLFQERFKSETVENAALFKNVLRYIHQNPLKDGLAQNIYENKWTSIHEYFKHKQNLHTYPSFSFSQNHHSINLFKKYMQEHNDDLCLEEHFITRKTDADVLLLLTYAGISNTSMLQQLDNKQGTQC